MNRRIPSALSALAAFALLLPAQEQPEKPAHPDVRLTYELPVDTLQRQLQQNPDQDLEQVLASIVRTMQSRLGAFGTVTRHEAEKVAAHAITLATPEEVDDFLFEEADRLIGT